MTTHVAQTNVDRVAAEFAAAVAQNIRHELTWVANWYSKLAQAALEDEVQLTFGVSTSKLNEDQKKAFGLCLLKRVMRTSLSADRQSTSLGDNAMKAAALAAEANLARILVGNALTKDEEAAWTEACGPVAPAVALG